MDTATATGMAMDTVKKKMENRSNRIMVLVDIHSHILPGIDDGSPDLDSSLGLAEAAVADGITHALMTPHTLNGKYLNHKEGYH